MSLGGDSPISNPILYSSEKRELCRLEYSRNDFPKYCFWQHLYYTRQHLKFSHPEFHFQVHHQAFFSKPANSNLFLESRDLKLSYKAEAPGRPCNNDGNKTLLLKQKFCNEVDLTQEDQVLVVLQHHIHVQFLLSWVQAFPLLLREFYGHIRECQ